METSEDSQRLFSEKTQELAWTRERLLLVPQSEDIPPSLARSYRVLEWKKQALEQEIADLTGVRAP